MDKFVKFCKPEHNILDSCHTVQFGTLEYYREMDPLFDAGIADATEGLETTVINDLDTADATQESIAVIEPVFKLNKDVKLINCAVTAIFPNCYIWCCSKLSEPVTPEQGTQFNKAYTSNYEINDAPRFFKHLETLLLTNITRTAFTDESRQKIDAFSISEMKEILLTVMYSNVRYVDEKISTIDEGRLKAFYPNIPAPFRQIFTKPKKFEEDREFRMVYLFLHPRYGNLAVKKDPVVLPLIPI